jgi:hypothetical protein
MPGKNLACTAIAQAAQPQSVWQEMCRISGEEKRLIRKGLRPVAGRTILPGLTDPVKLAGGGYHLDAASRAQHASKEHRLYHVVAVVPDSVSIPGSYFRSNNTTRIMSRGFCRARLVGA